MPRGVGQARPHGASSHLWPHRTRSDAALALPHLAGSPFAPAWLTASIPAATQTGCHKPAGRGRGRGPRTLGGCRPNGTARPHPGPYNTRAASDVLTVPPCWWSKLAAQRSAPRAPGVQTQKFWIVLDAKKKKPTHRPKRTTGPSEFWALSAGHTVRSQRQVTASAGQRRSDVEIKSYLQDAAGHRSLVFDLSITHDRIGSSCRTVCYHILRTLTPPCVSLRSAK